MSDPKIDRIWLSKADNSLRACAAFMKNQEKLTHFDPIYVACAYNAGGLYENTGAENRWKLRQFPLGTGRHANRFAAYFAAGSGVLTWPGGEPSGYCSSSLALRASRLSRMAETRVDAKLLKGRSRLLLLYTVTARLCHKAR